jgi:hypothetical protein
MKTLLFVTAPAEMGETGPGTFSRKKRWPAQEKVIDHFS